MAMEMILTGLYVRGSWFPLLCTLFLVHVPLS